MKREELKEASYYVKRCLELDPMNVKANYRRAQIAIGRKKWR